MALEDSVLEAEFDNAVKRWKYYIKFGKDSQGASVLFSPRTESAVECRAYKEIVAMGDKALYLIRELYERKDNDFSFRVLKERLPCLVRDIVGEVFEIPEAIRGKADEIENYTKQWLDSFLHAD